MCTGSQTVRRVVRAVVPEPARAAEPPSLFAERDIAPEVIDQRRIALLLEIADCIDIIRARLVGAQGPAGARARSRAGKEKCARHRPENCSHTFLQGMPTAPEAPFIPENATRGLVRG